MSLYFISFFKNSILPVIILRIKKEKKGKVRYLWENVVDVLCVCVVYVLWMLLSCSSRDARVVKDMTTGKSKGYGFVSFYNKLVRLQCRNTR